MTDVPAASREALVGALMPTLLTPVREITCDDGATRKTVWRLFDGTLVESVLMRYFGPAGPPLAELGDESDDELLAAARRLAPHRRRVGATGSRSASPARPAAG